MGRWAIAKIEWYRNDWQWFVFRPCQSGCEHAHRFITGDTPRFDTWAEAMVHVRRELTPVLLPPWAEVLVDDTSRWSMAGMRLQTPMFIVDGMKELMRDFLGDEAADAMEATIPPPYGTLGEKK